MTHKFDSTTETLLLKIPDAIKKIEGSMITINAQYAEFYQHLQKQRESGVGMSPQAQDKLEKIFAQLFDKK